MFKIKFPTKRIFRILPVLRTDGMAPFCNLLFMERPLYKENTTEFQPLEEHPIHHSPVTAFSVICNKTHKSRLMYKVK